jgi:hypothetical protein
MEDDLVTVATFGQMPEAEAALFRLQENGLTAYLADTETATLTFAGVPALTPIKLQVPPSQVEQAKALLVEAEQHKKQRAEEEWYLESEEEAPLNCLSCGKPMDENSTKCAHCGWSYT